MKIEVATVIKDGNVIHIGPVTIEAKVVEDSSVEINPGGLTIVRPAVKEYTITIE